MKAILLDGSLASNAASDLISNAISRKITSLGFEVEDILLREKNIGNCAGDFFCWIRTPGICNVKDDNILIAESIMSSDLIVYLTPITFGGYSSAMKKMVDHQIQSISPYFTTIKGETHHEKRYEKYPDFVVFGFTDKHDLFAESVFKQLVYRNSLNLYPENSICEIIHTDQSDQQILEIIQNSLTNFKSAEKLAPQQIQAQPEGKIAPFEIKRAVLLIGSPRTKKSTSFSMGDYLFSKLNDSQIATETIHIHTISQSQEKIDAMLKSLDSADLITLAFPLYVDSLPAPVIKVLETITAHRETMAKPRPTLFTAIVNCGFPEAYHNQAARLICEVFASQSGFAWGGSLSLGGGGMIDGTPLLQLGGRGYTTRKALDLAAEALIQGNPISHDAQQIMAKPAIPGWLYRIFGNLNWKQGSSKYGVQNQLRNKPYSSNPS
jgi:multimeric flavodoxin WrbA